MGSRGKPAILNNYRLSRRGRKLQVADDQRTLMALPRDVPERTWAEILQKEDNDLVCFEIREEIVDEALNICYDKYMEKQTALFTVHCTAQAWLKIIDWYFYRHDPGEEPTAYPPCYIPKRVESWTPDEMPSPSPKDTWGKQQLNVVEDCSEEIVCKWPSTESLDMPVVEPIPQEYWFPGKVEIEVPVEDEELDIDGSKSRSDRNRKAKRGAGAGSMDYDSTNTTTITTSDRALVEPESEVLQKVTDYTTSEAASSPKGTLISERASTVDGSLHGAGDSLLEKIRSKGSRGRFIKRSSGSRASRMTGSKLRYDVGSDHDSRTRLSVISDCRLRNLRLETQFEIESEKMVTPPGPYPAVKKK